MTTWVCVFRSLQLRGTSVNEFRNFRRQSWIFCLDFRAQPSLELGLRFCCLDSAQQEGHRTRQTCSLPLGRIYGSYWFCAACLGDLRSLKFFGHWQLEVALVDWRTPMPLNPFATAFTPGQPHQSHKATAALPVTAPPVLHATDSIAASQLPPADTATSSILPAASVSSSRATPFAETQASINSSADDTLQLEFEDLFHRGQNVSCFSAHLFFSASVPFHGIMASAG